MIIGDVLGTHFWQVIKLYKEAIILYKRSNYRWGKEVIMGEVLTNFWVIEKSDS